MYRNIDLNKTIALAFLILICYNIGVKIDNLIQENIEIIGGIHE